MKTESEIREELVKIRARMKGNIAHLSTTPITGILALEAREEILMWVLGEEDASD